MTSLNRWLGFMMKKKSLKFFLDIYEINYKSYTIFNKKILFSTTF